MVHLGHGRGEVHFVLMDVGGGDPAGAIPVRPALTRAVSDQRDAGEDGAAFRVEVYALVNDAMTARARMNMARRLLRVARGDLATDA